MSKLEIFIREMSSLYALSDWTFIIYCLVYLPSYVGQTPFSYLGQTPFSHDLRHTFASLLIDQGENIKFIQSQLGHASIQTTLDRYGHLLPLKNYIGVGKRRLDEKIFTPQEAEISDLSNHKA